MTKEQFEKADYIMSEIKTLKRRMQKIQKVQEGIKSGEEYCAQISVRNHHNNAADFVINFELDFALKFIGDLCDSYKTRLAELEKEFENL